jgi:hypothetical protein
MNEGDKKKGLYFFLFPTLMYLLLLRTKQTSSPNSLSRGKLRNENELYPSLGPSLQMYIAYPILLHAKILAPTPILMYTSCVDPS